MPTNDAIRPPYEADGCRLGKTANLNMTELPKTYQAEFRKAAAGETSPRLAQTEHSGNMAVLNREYEFFTTTNVPLRAEGTERGRIRRLVMRNFFESKTVGSQENGSEHSSASTVMAKKQLKNRFRLSKDGGEKPATKSKKSNGKEAPSRAKRKRTKAAQTSPGVSDDSRSTEDGTSLQNSTPATSAEDRISIEGKSKGKVKDVRILLKISPSAHRLDPFDVLPVPGSPQLDLLFRLCKLCSSPFHPRKTNRCH